MSTTQATPLSYQFIDAPLLSYQIQTVVHHPIRPLLLLIGKSRLQIWDYQTQHTVAISEPLSLIGQGGFYPDDEHVWALTEADSGSVDWGIWNYETNTYNVYELERHGHYGRGAVLHPSGMLIGALWNAYECGYHIHEALPGDNELHYFSQPAPTRQEYEAFLPTFSKDGRCLAFFANPYSAYHENHSILCLYNVTTANSIFELTTQNGFELQQLQFAHSDKTLIFYDEQLNLFQIIDTATAEIAASIQPDLKIQFLTGHSRYGFYAVIEENGLAIYYDSDSVLLPSTSDYKKVAQDTAEEIIRNGEEHRFVAGG